MDTEDGNQGLRLGRTGWLVVTLLLLALFAGSYYFFFARPPGKSRVYPTDGVVLFQGKPAVGARVTLFSEDKAARFLPTGIVAEDGTFRLTTYIENDGAPAGRYRVGIVRGPLDGNELTELKKKHTPEEVGQIVAEKSQDPLFSKYANAGLTAEIPVPGKQLRFELD